jgi:MORN repeat
MLLLLQLLLFVAKTGYYTGEFLATTPGIGHSTAFPLANGLRHGKGTRVWASGNRYEGNRF